MNETSKPTPASMVDVVVIGGGAAGLSAAVTLGRSRRSVVVVDSGEPRNAPAAGVHNFLTRDGVSPRELVALGRAEVESYGGVIVEDEVVETGRDGDGFVVTLAGGRRIGARRLLVTAGLVDELPDVPGVREQWGTGVVHCPYCHGWEIRDEPIGVLGVGPRSVHQVMLFRQLSDDVVYFRHDAPPPTDEEAAQLAARGVRVVPGRVAGLVIEDGRLTGVRLEDGEVVPRRAVAVATRMVARTAYLAGVGLKATPDETGAGERIETDPMGATTVPGVFAAGNVRNLMATVATAAADGVNVAGMVNWDLVAEDTRLAMEGA
jgi:thioredoxin reductase